MSIQTPLRTVVEGEASESDDDADYSEAHLDVATDSRTGVIVSGEASESEDEVDVSESSNTLPPLTVDHNSHGDAVSLGEEAKVKLQPKYDTLLHKKLREKNTTFRNHLSDFIGHNYLSSAKDIRSMTNQLVKTQAAIQDVSHNMRLLTNTLFHLEDKVDIVATCSILPDIDIIVPSSGSPSRSPTRSTRSSPSR